MFENLGLRSFAKTSGSKGLQVYLPLNSDGVSFEQSKLFARTVAQLLEQADGELVISSMSRARREGKVLIDWSQNDEHKTTVCVYSLRATERPSVSMPLEWEEVQRRLRRGRPREPALQRRPAPLSASPTAATCSRPCSRSCSGCRRCERSGGEAFGRAGPALGGLDLAVLRRGAAHKRIEQAGRRRLNLINRPVEGLRIRL